MNETLLHPRKSMLEVWESLPEGTLCQLINNRLIMSPGPQNLHQVILNDINIQIYQYSKTNKIGEVRISPFDVFFSKENILQPDIIFIKNENLGKIKTKGLFGAPDIVIEILSPSTSSLDFEEKKLIYEKFAVQEYFIVEPNSKTVSSFFLKNMEYQEQELTESCIRSVVLNTEIHF